MQTAANRKGKGKRNVKMLSLLSAQFPSDPIKVQSFKCKRLIFRLAFDPTEIREKRLQTFA
jgi:hypothetical protein